MTWQFYIIISVILYAISVILQRLILKENESHPIAYSAFFQLVTGLLIGIAGFAFGKMQLPDFSTLPWFNLILMVFLYGFANVFIFKSLKQIESSNFTIIFATRSLFTILASSLLIRETLNITQWLGALMIFSGVVLVSRKASKFSFSKGEVFALLGAIGFGIGNSNDKYILNFMQLYPYVSIAFIAPAILIYLIYYQEAKQVKMFLNKSVLSKILLLCVIYAVSSITFYIALQDGDNSSQLAAVNLTSVIITVLLGVIFLKERENVAKKIIGALLSFAGLLLVS